MYSYNAIFIIFICFFHTSTFIYYVIYFSIRRFSSNELAESIQFVDSSSFQFGESVEAARWRHVSTRASMLPNAERCKLMKDTIEDMNDMKDINRLYIYIYIYSYDAIYIYIYIFVFRIHLFIYHIIYVLSIHRFNSIQIKSMVRVLFNSASQCRPRGGVTIRHALAC